MLTWELGLNLGHLSRLFPVALTLKRGGHNVIVVTRDIRAADRVFGDIGIKFMQSPGLSRGPQLHHRTTGFADILRTQGWGNFSTLSALTKEWLALFSQFKPDKLILDYSPTVSLAARIAQIPAILIGNGFELPPLTDPLPPFPELPWATQERAAVAEKAIVTIANRVLEPFTKAPLSALCDMYADQVRLFATFPELDHYGARQDATYIGPLLRHLTQPQIKWPRGTGPKIFACIKPDTSRVAEILFTLSNMNGRVVCVASGFATSTLQPYMKGHIHYSFDAIDISSLRDADLCISYGAEGTMIQFLLAGVPQLIAPWYVEAFMAARKIESNRLGLTAKIPDNASIAFLIDTLLTDTTFRNCAGAFARRYSNSSTGNAVNSLIRHL
jgi:UDP:flavonoid glycosyltransferase YjiC (YdhE family)